MLLSKKQLSLNTIFHSCLLKRLSFILFETKLVMLFANMLFGGNPPSLVLVRFSGNFFQLGKTFIQVNTKTTRNIK